MKVVVFGDFNCPYSRLASARVDAMQARGIDVEWRAVEHDRSIPSKGVQVSGELRNELEREIREIAELMVPPEDVAFVIPDVRPNTRDDCELFARLSGGAADAFRRECFDAIWDGGPGAATDGPRDSEQADAWQIEWESIPDRMVPLLVEDATQTRGVEALRRLGELLG
jgi:hypothetical protein